MFHTMEDVLTVYKGIVEGTRRLLDSLDDEILDASVGEGYRGIRHLAWHIVVTVPEMMNRTGLGLSSVDPEAPPPKSAAEIAAAYRTVTSETLEAFASKWTDATLSETDDMYGAKWKRGFSVMALIHHEIHHRAQIVVLLRQAGRKVPGLFGPSKEEWSNMGMEPPPY